MARSKRKRRFGVIFSRDIKFKFDKMKRLLIQCIRKMKIMKITAEELMSEEIIMKKPY